MKYQKKPVIVEAFQYGVDLFYPEWLVDAMRDGVFYFVDNKAFIKTLEGDMEVGMCDYIIQGVRGELYPCKPDIFRETYEEV